jgi:hypothetical protein
MLFDQLFVWVRQRFAQALLGGLEDAKLAIERQVVRESNELEVSQGVTLLLEGPKPKKARA